MQRPPLILDNVMPKNAALWERVLGSNVDRFLDLDVEQIRHLWDPWKIDIDDLPYLAWALSVDIWDSAWPDAKKRSVVANAFKHHRLKGTLLGIEIYLKLHGTEVVKVVTPKTKFFSGPSLTREAREKWLTGLPQIRLYRNYSRGDAGNRMFTGGQLYPRFREKRFLQPSTAADRLKPRAKWIVNGQETDARVIQLDVNDYQILVNTRDRGAVYSGQKPRRKRFLLPSIARSRILTVTPVSQSPWRAPIGPTLTPVTSEPELVAERHPAGPGVFSGMRPKKRILVPSRARFHRYQRFAVLDGSAPVKRPSTTFTGVGRYGYPGHKAEITLRIRAPLEDRQARFGPPSPKKRFWLPHNPEPMNRAKSAIVSAKRLSDQIVVRTDTSRGIIAGLPFFAGDVYLA